MPENNSKVNSQKALEAINIDKPQLLQNTIQCFSYNGLTEKKVAKIFSSFLEDKGIHFCEKCNKELAAAVCQCLEANVKEQEMIQPMIEFPNRTEMQDVTMAALTAKKNVDKMMAEVDRRKNLLCIKRSIPSAEKLKFKNYEYAHSDFVETALKMNTESHQNNKKDFAAVLDEEMDESVFPTPEKTFDYRSHLKQPLVQKIGVPANDTKADHQNIFHEKLDKMVTEVESLKEIYFTKKRENTRVKKQCAKNPPTACYYLNRDLMNDLHFKKPKNATIDFTQTKKKEDKCTTSMTEKNKNQQSSDTKSSKTPEVPRNVIEKEMWSIGVSPVPSAKCPMHSIDSFHRTEIGCYKDYRYNIHTPGCAPKLNLQGSATKISINLKNPTYLPPLGPPPMLNPIPPRLPPLPGCPRKPKPQGSPQLPKKSNQSNSPCKKFSPITVLSFNRNKNVQTEVDPAAIQPKENLLHRSFVKHVLSVHCKNKDPTKSS